MSSNAVESDLNYCILNFSIFFHSIYFVYFFRRPDVAVFDSKNVGIPGEVQYSSANRHFVRRMYFAVPNDGYLVGKQNQRPLVVRL